MANELLNSVIPYLGHLKGEIELVLSLDDSQTSRELNALAEGLSSKSRLVFVRHDTLLRTPSLGISVKNQQPRVFFSGIPSGHEATSFLLSLLNVSGHPSKEDVAFIDKANRINKQLDIDIYVSLSCHNCPEVVQAANLIAMLNPNVRSSMIDGSVFKTEVEEKGIMAVPSIYVNGKHIKNGRLSPFELLDLLQSEFDCFESSKETAEEDLGEYDMTIIGSGPGGAMAAVYAARKGIRVAMIGDRLGGQLNETSEIQNMSSISSITGEGMTKNILSQLNMYEIDRFEGSLVDSIQFGDTHIIKTNSGKNLSSKTVVVSTGASWKELKIEGESEYKGKGVCYCPHCDGPLFKSMPVAVVGGGNSGVEAAIDLSGTSSKVTLFVRGDKMKADKILQDKINSISNIEIIFNSNPISIQGDGNKVTSMLYVSKGMTQEILLDAVFVQIGLSPNTAFLAKTGIDLNEFNAIEVDKNQRTNLPGVYAAGDCTDSEYNQVVIAAGQGAAAALSAFDYLMKH